MNIGIIMDGNGRWAKKNSFNITRGHEQGINVVREIGKEIEYHLQNYSKLR